MNCPGNSANYNVSLTVSKDFVDQLANEVLVLYFLLPSVVRRLIGHEVQAPSCNARLEIMVVWLYSVWT